MSSQPPRILLLGASGQLGRELHRSLRALGPVVAADRRPRASCEALDLGDRRATERLVARADPQVVVNAAGYTAVDRAEHEAATAHRMNGELPARLAGIAARRGALLVHFSTDYVFDGRSHRPYREDDRAAPLNAYGRSKLEGERRILESGAPHLLVRTSWLYSTYGRNFLLAVLARAAAGAELRVVDDQRGAPTAAPCLAWACTRLIRRWLGADPAGRSALHGCWHLSAAGECTWYEFARAVLARAGLERARVRPVSTEAYGLRTPRPRYSVLDGRKAARRLGLALAPWPDQLDRVMIAWRAARGLPG